MSYDFRTLDSEEFEKLIRDILAKKFDCHIERFGKGRDGGVDLRFNSNGGEKVVVQCKHYANSTLSNLLSTLKNEELKKVKEMKLSRYMVVTSLNLTPNNKEKIMEIMTPHIKSESDIWGLTEINDYVNEYKDIELRNYKLWFRSTSVLSNVINAGVHNRTKILLNKIKNKVEYYVEPEEFDLAYQMVDEENYCIICGKPGIGKSSLAEVLLFRYFKEDYMIIKVNDIQEILQLHNSEIKQIFYFDDFFTVRSFVPAALA